MTSVIYHFVAIHSITKFAIVMKTNAVSLFWIIFSIYDRYFEIFHPVVNIEQSIINQFLIHYTQEVFCVPIFVL